MDNNSKKYKDINQNDFMSEVIESSKDILVVVDFWAPWCGPCKELGPKIEKIIGQNSDKIKLVKLNIDENQELAMQMQIKSIPIVYAFKDGQPINAFQGNQPESEIIKFLEKSLGEKLKGNYVEIIAEARTLLNEEKYDESNSIIEEVISSSKDNKEAIEILIKNYVGLNEMDSAKQVIDSLEKNLLQDANIKSAIEVYNLKKGTEESGPKDEIILLVKKDPLNIENSKKLSDIYFAEKNYDEAFNIIFNLYSKTKKENKDKVKKILLNYFELLGNTHEKTKEARRKLSSIMFS